MGCNLSKEPKIAVTRSLVVLSTTASHTPGVSLRIKIPNDISKKEISIRPIKMGDPDFNGSYFRD